VVDIKDVQNQLKQQLRTAKAVLTGKFRISSGTENHFGQRLALDPGLENIKHWGQASFTVFTYKVYSLIRV
jgi:hypothetical protein